VLTGVMLGGLAAVGGLGFAASQIAHAGSSAKVDFGHKLAAINLASSAAADQYGGVTVSSNTVSTSAIEGSAGGVATEVPGTSQAVVVNWDAATFTEPVTVHVDPTPPPQTSSALVGSGNQLISIVVTNASGQVVHDLSSPIDITFKNPPPNFVPVISTDGVNFRAVPLLSGTTLPAGQSDGYYVAADGSIHILTMHLTVFAVLYKANINVSETGRKTPQAGSGIFGDPTRNHTGAPKLNQVGTTITPSTSPAGATYVPFTYYVDEQAATWIAIFDSNGKAVDISRTGTYVRGHRYSGTPVKNLHLVILRPGQIKTMLRIPKGVLIAGHTYKIRVTAVDFDGHKTVAYATFKA
jgi:hypothetical protein